MRYVDYYEKGWLSELAFSPNKLIGGKMIREAYKIHSVNNNISKIGLVRLYQRLLSENRIKEDGAAHRRLNKILEDRECFIQ